MSWNALSDGYRGAVVARAEGDNTDNDSPLARNPMDGSL